ncbi:hypothetical protein [Sporomusa sp.]|uniref:hypothetical protein n=1 Tax=Sporomusa sp. TaxID=2078658 RepID=UPI002C362DF4|nr:hypothetical protein [Sporomusa sp.]HWR42110.1 hypothetical protein [Sporomusa sp.]
MNVKSYAVLASLIIVLITASIAFASADQAEAVSMPQALLITKGTIIKVQAVDTISSQQKKQNDKVHFKVIEDLTIGDVTIVPANTEVAAIVTKVKKAGPWGRDGQIEVTFSEIKTMEDHALPVTGTLQLLGGKQNFLVKYSLGGIFIKGKEAVIKAGTPVNLKIKEDTQVTRAELSPKPNDND